ncbi:MAG: hypothetical protein WCB46_00270, partial [Methanoregula sp.]
MRLLEKFITDKYAIIIFILAVILIPVVLVFVFDQTPLSIFSALIIVPNILYALVKDFRQKTLFRKSTPSVSVNKGPKVLFWILDG